MRTGEVYDLISLVDLDGQVIATNRADAKGKSLDTEKIVGVDVGDEEWFKAACEASAKQGPGVEPVWFNPEQDVLASQVYGEERRTICISIPLFDKDGKFIRVWTMHASWPAIHGPLVERTEHVLASKGYAFEMQILRDDGVVMHDNDEAAEFKLNLAQAGLVAAQKAIAGESGSTQEPNTPHGRGVPHRLRGLGGQGERVGPDVAVPPARQDRGRARAGRRRAQLLDADDRRHVDRHARARAVDLEWHRQADHAQRGRAATRCKGRPERAQRAQGLRRGRRHERVARPDDRRAARHPRLDRQADRRDQRGQALPNVRTRRASRAATASCASRSTACSTA
jgi:hypothetical protein